MSIIAVDFDGTLTYPSPYPITGKPNVEVINKIKQLQRDNVIILYTCREGDDLKEAVSICASYGLYFDLINENVPEHTKSRKIWADIYFDDKAVNNIDNLLRNLTKGT